MVLNMGIYLLLVLLGPLATDGMLFSVELVLPRYVPLGGSAQLRCEYSVQRDVLHKVEWLRGHNKLLQFVKDRKPPFRHYTILGAVIDKNHSNEREIMLKDLTLSASGYYTCEVSTQYPIFTTTSNEEELTVIIPQRTPPEVTIRKPIYTVGQWLEANCSSSPAHPVPHITWLLNGDPVADSYLRFFPSEQVIQGEHLSSSTVQLTMPVEYDDIGADGRLQLVCVSTIPAFLDARAGPHEYADYKSQEASVEVLIPEVTVDAGKSRLSPHLVLVTLLPYIAWTSTSHSSAW